MNDIVATQMAPRRFVMWTVGFFGLVAILTAAVVLTYRCGEPRGQLGWRQSWGMSPLLMQGDIMSQSRFCTMSLRSVR